MKILKYTVLSLLILVAVFFFVGIFALQSNTLAPIVEEQINKNLNINSKVKRFVVTINSIDVDIDLTPHNNIKIAGIFSLGDWNFDINYYIKLLALNELESLTKTKLNGQFKTDGNVKGDFDLKQILIKGKSDVAKSATDYDVVLTDLNPTKIVASVKDLDIPTLLYMLNRPRYASAKLNIDANFKNITPHKLDGYLKLTTTNGVFNQTVLKKDFNVTIPYTTFNTNLKANLKGDDVVYTFLFDSNLARLSSNGKVTPDPLKLDVKYYAKIKNLSLLKPVTKADLQGSINANGIVKGTKESLNVTLKSDIAKSYTNIKINLKDFQPKNITASIKHLKLQKLLWMVKQPHYTDGDFNLKADIDIPEQNKFKGYVKTSVTDGDLDTVYLTKTYQFKHKMPSTTYTLNTYSKLQGTLIDTNIKLISSLADLNVKSAKFDIKDASLKSDYTASVKNLDRLYFVTDKHLRGGITANGEIKKDKNLLFTSKSDIAKGKLNLKLLNDDLKITLNGMQTKELLHILIYPEIFASSIDADINYNLKQQKGNAKAKLNNGHFVKNQAFDLLKQYNIIDMYKEEFNGDVDARIKQEKILASMLLTSKRSHIKTTNTYINTKTQKIDSTLNIKANEDDFDIRLKGDIAKPTVSVNIQKLIKTKTSREIQKKAKKEINKLFKKMF